MRKLLFMFAVQLMVTPSQAQLLKKIKDKVNKTIDKAAGGGSEETRSSSDNSSSSSTPSAVSDDDGKTSKKVLWCDTVLVDGGATTGSGPVKVDESKSGGVEYEMVYSSGGKINIEYNESALGIGKNRNGYRLILQERIDNKSQYVVLQDGKVIYTGATVKNEHLGNGISGQFSVGNSSNVKNEEMKQYIVADSVKHDLAGQDAKSVKINKVTDQQADMALQMARQSDEYKSMSAEEKKEFEEMMKKGSAQNNSMAGQTISTPAMQATSYSTVSGYRVVVKGKTYGKFSMPPAVEVSDAMVFAVGADENGNPVLISNSKKTPLDKTKVTGMNGQIVRSPDLKKFVYVEMKPMTDAEMDAISADPANARYKYTIIKSDGSVFQITDYTQSGKFQLTNSGAVININNLTAEVYADGKSVGKFKVKEGYSLEPEAIMVGDNPSKIAYYDGAEGSINYIDGTVKKLGIMYPTVVSENGKNYITWFRKCRNNIYKAKFPF